jgi:hypothetical protein
MVTETLKDALRKNACGEVEQGDVTGLTAAERELIAMLAEECGEVVQICMKILRHGLESYNPEVPVEERYTNRQLLRQELTDVEAVKNMLVADDVVPEASLRAVMHAVMRKYRYTHHQGDPTTRFPTDWLNDR